MNNPKTLLAVLSSSALLAAPASAELFIYEPFDYTPTSPINDGRYFGDATQPYDTGLGLGAWTHRDNPNNVPPINEGDVADEGVEFTDSKGNVLPVAGNAYERRNRVGQVAASAPIDPAATTGLTADNSTIWMTFLFQDFGFSGPDFGIGMHSEKFVSDDNQGLETAGYGVGFGIVSSGGQARNIRTAVYNNSVGASQLAAEATPTFNGPGASGVFLLAMKVNWKPSGTPDEIFAFIIDDLTTEPDEGDAVVSDTFDFDLSTQQSLDFFNFSDTQVGYVDEIRVATTFAEAVGGTAPTESKIPLVITPNDPTSRFRLTWDSQAGMLYNVRSSTDLGSDPLTWPLVEGDVAATPPENTKDVDPTETDLFYIVEEYPAPPVEIFSENFDGTTPGSLPADWTSGKNNPPDSASLTNWELGTPANVGPVPPGVPLPSASNCVATGIGANYDDPVSDLGVAHTDIWLRTPAINLGAATAGTLSFQQWTQIEDVPGDLDHGSIRILDASDDSELAVMEDQSIDGSTTGWEEYSMELPAAAFTATAGTIKIEFQFEADDIDSFAGWYIDDVAVTVPGS